MPSKLEDVMGKEIKAGIGEANKVWRTRLAQEGSAAPVLPPAPGSSQWAAWPHFSELSLPWAYM